MERCPWSEGFEQYRRYHDEEWGVPLRDSQALFELLMLEGAQAGLSWSTILKKRENYREAFDGFDPMRIAAYGPDDEARLMANAGIVRNRLKVAGVIKGARAYLAMEASGTRFSDFVWQFVGGEPLQNRWTSLNEVPASTAVSDAMSKALKKAGFTFVGSTICYSFMQASGMVNDHLVACPRHKAVKSHPGATSLLRVSPPRKRRSGASSATIAPDESGSA
ncbi:DNA-3-methyladenine glycosylase [Pandoraea pnomenusa]|uniref:DNA-3-methyladenine glycosylase I n=1 Tax=Pandoraea pnomenusa TaxID=93220 RepID=UPI00043757B5|nr:DNA-3-methyladenine glycosylase I [Pandoraea pnomenusa]AHN74059.1 DNA-3-methyladenine glycosylase [Pandoraea pnomenusa]